MAGAVLARAFLARQRGKSLDKSRSQTIVSNIEDHMIEGLPDTGGRIKDRILCALATQAFHNRLARIDYIIESAWPNPADEPQNPKRNIQVILVTLRKELKPHGFVIKNVHGVGYRLERTPD